MKQYTGNVISTHNTLSAVVVVESSWKHPLYKKTIKRSKKFLVHNTVSAKLGDIVVIQETRPMSARKRFTIIEVINK